ncbi:hypothetical protein AA103581_0358 [Gluconobacter wancherniae NBRC 103581]|nr:hypothetical protein AA103581_0358 [Gluconobacter wancherniae NBRC 103581]
MIHYRFSWDDPRRPQDTSIFPAHDQTPVHTRQASSIGMQHDPAIHMRLVLRLYSGRNNTC